ncbi:Pkinase-domain-containing protein [Rhodofomes roseus]|uniref:Pkinase-domain-containing protein n=1 Tax=Rhodofomes roseus TaxID=34475 RepID=A0ABQ8K465_9APHY|nr:Pkinase-domain-containing protein [Rhodofomes roseus]KAH9831161.1 Pkinase-domain-containing protein [Rhodofomes roseus]
MKMHTSASIPEMYDHVIDDGRLQFIEKLGEGAYGVVYRAVDLDSPTSSRCPDPKQYAIKVMMKAQPRTRQQRFQRGEIAAHRRVSAYPNILTLHKVIEDSAYIYLVMDYCPGGDLFHHITERKTYGGSTNLVKNVFVQILDAVRACHEQGIAHRDIKPDNILCMNESGSRVVLADFGLSTSSERSSTFGCGSSFYTSPETSGIDFGYKPYDAKVADVWSLGVLLVNMIAGRNPWTSATIEDQCFLRSMTRPGYLQKMLPISDEAVTILQRIFTYDPKMRITIPELREAILKVKTFFMTEPQLAKGHRFAQIAARTYFQKYYSLTEEDYREMNALEEAEFGRRENLVEALVVESPTNHFRLVDCVGSTGMPSMTNSDSDSDAESIGPVTPVRNAVEVEALAEVPPLKDGEDMGVPVVPTVVKKRRDRPFESLVHLMERFAL